MDVNQGRVKLLSTSKVFNEALSANTATLLNGVCSNVAKSLASASMAMV